MAILSSCELRILFSRVKFKLGHKFSQFIHIFKIWILKCRSWAVYTFNSFPIHERDGKLASFNSLGCTSKFFPIHLKNCDFWSPLAFIFCQMARIVFQYNMWRSRGGVNLWLNCQFSRKNTYNVGNNFLSLSDLEILFQNINVGINCKIFMWLCCLPPDPPTICSMERITLASQGFALLGFFPICNIIFPIIDQCWYFWPLW